MRIFLLMLSLFVVLGCSSETQTAVTSTDSDSDSVQQSQTPATVAADPAPADPAAVDPAPVDPAPADPAAADPGVPAQVGVWKPVTGELGGTKLPDTVAQSITLTLTAATYESTIGGADGQTLRDIGTYKLDEQANPKRITITSSEGPNKGKTQLAIFEMTDDGLLRICYDLTGNEFPKEFKSEPGTQLFLVNYGRQQEPPAKETTPK